MGNVKYYLNKTSGTPENRPIMILYHFKGEKMGNRLRYYTGLWLAENEFNKDSKGTPAKSTCIDRIYINTRLALIRNYIGEVENEALAKGEALTLELFKTKLNTKFKPQKPQVVTPQAAKITLLQYFDIFIEDSKTRINKQTGRKLSKAMPIKFNNVKNLFNDFCTFEGMVYDFEDINETFHKRFIAYMLNEKDYSVNTYGRALRFIKSLLIAATKAGYNTNLYYMNITGTQEASESIYLNEDELQKIYKLDLSTRPGLERVRDLFILGCNTGLRFSDYTKIAPDDVQGDRIRLVTQKTNSKVIIPLMTQAKEILQKYNFQLPKAISNQKFNENLKEVAELAGLTDIVITHITKGGKATTTKQKKYKLCTSHVARRSFATNYYKLGIDKLEIMAITGHKTEAEFLKYIKVTGEEKADSFEKNVMEKRKPKIVRKPKAAVNPKPKAKTAK